MKRSTSFMAGLAASALVATTSVSATDHAGQGASKSEAVGVGTGFVIGAALGGPVGAILGGALGGHYGDTRHQAKTQEALASATLDELERQRIRLTESMTEQERLDFQLESAHADLDQLNKRITQLFVERALVDGLQFDVHFDTDEVVLDEADRTRLVRLSKLLTSLPDAKVALHGFADIRGKNDYNEALSLDRAYTVADTLSALGVDESQIKTYALGESQSIDRGADVDAYSHDRRVSIRLQLPVADDAMEAQENAKLEAKTINTGSGQ